MEKFLLTILSFLACLFSIKAQVLYGTTYYGGSDQGGTINKFTPSTNNLTVTKSLESTAINPVYTNFIQASDGRLYGMTTSGGRNSAGTIFSFDQSTSTYTDLEDFDVANGSSPYGSLIQASDGKLYGLTQQGGSIGDGVIFSFDPSTSTYTKLEDFDGTDGSFPNGSLMQAGDGKLYGVTASGGISGHGVIFSFDLSSSTYTKLKDLDGDNGAYPYDGLVQASNGKLYGLTQQGGSNGYGVIFSFDPSSSTYTKLTDFDDTNGAYPYGNLTKASDGKLYGMTSGGGSSNAGVIFSFDPSSSIYTKLKDLDDINGDYAYGSLIEASDGKLYGMTDGGGANSSGTIFSFDPSSSTYTKLKDFDGTNGANPNGSLVQATDGKLYGMTSFGGSGTNGMTNGVIFSFDLPSSTYTKLKNFGSNETGTNAAGSLTLASNGKLYGMTVGGGGGGFGAIFSFDPSSSTFTKLKDFNGPDGANPTGNLLQASDGKLYGMTNAGGNSSNGGVIFSFDPSSSTYTKLEEFDYTNGSSPYGGLIQASDGKLYGMTLSGGINGSGVLFSFDPSSSTYTKVEEFDNILGGSPFGNLLQASDGKLYGMTGSGGTGNGVIFSFDLSTSTYTDIKEFDVTHGGNPYGNLIQAGDGKLYGLTNQGGLEGYGVIFSFDPSSSTYMDIWDFNITDGAYPLGSLIQASDGKLYGLTRGGGSNDDGVVFSFDPSTFIYTKLSDYTGANGAGPDIGSAFIEVTGALPVTLVGFTGENKGNNNQLSWKAANELDLNYYELQRGTDGQKFKAVSQIKALGNSSYTYNDPIADEMSSLFYYRLKSVDKDGRFTYSPVIKIRTSHNGFAVVNPNPFKDRLVVNVSSLIQDNATLIITDINGRQLYKAAKPLSAGNNVIEINETGTLSKGTYLLTIIGSQQTQTIKIVKGN